MEFQKKSTLSLSLSNGRKRQSKQTNFVHYCYENSLSTDTIPLLENFYFTLSLFRSKTLENMQEAKSLLEKLLEFQVKENFPIYLHQYPLCLNSKLGQKIYPILFWIQKEFDPILGSTLQEKLKKAIDVIPNPLPPLFPPLPNSENLAEFMIQAQLHNLPLDQAFEKWHASLGCFLEEQKQEETEPALSLFDLFCAEQSEYFPLRILKDHPTHLKSSIIRKEASFKFPAYPVPFMQELPFKLLWKDTNNHIHSLVLETKGSLEEDKTIHLSSIPQEDEMEIAFFLSAHPTNSILVNNKRASSFQIKDKITISSPTLQIELSFEMIEGTALFFGHIFKANRSGQIKDDKNSECYDWKIALRTLRRDNCCKVKYQLKLLEG